MIQKLLCIVSYLAFSGNITISLYMQRRVSKLKMKVTVGPPGMEESRIITERDIVFPQDELEENDFVQISTLVCSRGPNREPEGREHE